MAYQTGDVIENDHYNLFATGSAEGTFVRDAASVKAVMNNGASSPPEPNAGYQQGISLPGVSVGDTITATQWATMLNNISTAATHQGTTITSISNPVVGDTIVPYAALQSNINAIWNNRLNAAVVGSSSATNITRTAVWRHNAIHTATFTFSDYADLRAFFNCGGHIKITMSRTGGSSTSKNTEWTDLCNKMGTLVLTAASGAGTANLAGTSYTGFNKVGGGGTPEYTNTGVGVYDLIDYGTHGQALIKQYADTAPYTDSSITVTGTHDPEGTVKIEVKYIDGDTGGYADENVDGTLQTTFTVVQPSTAALTQSWTLPTVTTTNTGA